MLIFKLFKSRMNGAHTAYPFLLSLLVLCFCFAPAASAAQAPVKLTILHVNDTHGHIVPYVEKSIDENTPVSGADYLAVMIERQKAANPEGCLLLSAGDMFQGTPISNIFQGRPVIEIMNHLKYDAMALGNHEFDWGQDVLKNIVTSSNFPVLSANVFQKNGALFPGVKPYAIVKRHNVRIAIIGLTTTETPYTSKPGNLTGLSFVPPAQILPALIKIVHSKGASLIIVLSHLGLEADKDLAHRVRGIDIIVGGHSHTVVMNPVNESGTIIVQAGYNGLYLGALDIVYDPAKKKILDYTAQNELKLVSAGPQAPFDTDVARIIDKYEVQVRTEFSKVAGTALRDLTRRTDGESGLGDLITDAMREASGARIAFYNGGGIRADLLKGPVTLENVYTILPFDNQLVTMDLSGSQIRELMENSAQAEKLLQISGMKVEFDLSRPAGSKVVSIYVDTAPIDPEATYKVVTNDFLAAGGDQVTTFMKGRNTTFGSPVRDAVFDYIRTRSPVDLPVPGRISFAK
jgi:2',3'-cyclic-nucleotide 2'-phosphodiesterase (5'-nucleotidase family)